jgi:sugar lactone lactonase YvrE
LGFPEDPRWHEGALWFSDFGQRVVRTVGMDGRLEHVVHVAARPSGLGFMPDDSLLVVSMDDRRLLRFFAGQLTEHADLARWSVHACNDMVVSARGDAYVGHMGFDLFARPRKVVPASLLLVRPDGSVSVAADDLLFPNGVVITRDGGTLIVAETMGERLTAFAVLADGRLGKRRVFAELKGRAPDGICLDAEGAVWVADAAGKACVRVREGGQVTDVIATEKGCFACELGGPSGRTLFLCTAEGFHREAVERGTGSIECVEVEVPSAAATH